MNPYLMEQVKILDIQKETEIDYTYTLAYDKALMPGQFLQLSVPGVGEAPISVSDFETGKLYMTIRKVGRLTDAIFDLSVGDALYVRGPYGNGFDYTDFSGSDLKIIAGGTGLAPIKKVIKHFKGNSDVNSLEVLVGFKSPEDILFEDEVKEWSDSGVATVTVDHGNDEWTGKTGLVTQYLKDFDLSNMDNCKIIVVGPPIMMKFVTLELLKLGINAEQIWVSFERKMSCGIGKCGHCKIDETYVCLEGPVFKYTKAVTLLD